MKRSIGALAFLSLGVLSLSLATGCTFYQGTRSKDGMKYWVNSVRVPLGSKPVVWECCDTCGENGYSVCREATMLKNGTNQPADVSDAGAADDDDSDYDPNDENNT